MWSDKKNRHTISNGGNIVFNPSTRAPNSFFSPPQSHYGAHVFLNFFFVGKSIFLLFLFLSKLLPRRHLFYKFRSVFAARWRAPFDGLRQNTVFDSHMRTQCWRKIFLTSCKKPYFERSKIDGDQGRH